mmetsp:Transcript_6966/g.14028  ORF Transcript_6966/g.14028 Transcript_6966/m.14028 type:complete len:356 (+) Transcript_6966:135-1202(+)
MNSNLKPIVIALLATSIIASFCSAIPSSTSIAPAFSIRHNNPRRERTASRPSSPPCPHHRRREVPTLSTLSPLFSSRDNHEASTTSAATATPTAKINTATKTAQRNTNESNDNNNDNGYPLRIHHEGRVATIYVRENEPILQAMERQSLKPLRTTASPSPSSLALSNVPNDCRRGNCLTCASRIIPPSSNKSEDDVDGDGKGCQPRIVANVNNGLSPVMASHLQKSNYILTCCSYVTQGKECADDGDTTKTEIGNETPTSNETQRVSEVDPLEEATNDIQPINLEIDQSHKIWEEFYQNRLNPVGQSGRDARARLLRRVSEENVGRWKKRMEVVWEESGRDDAVGYDDGGYIEGL